MTKLEIHRGTHETYYRKILVERTNWEFWSIGQPYDISEDYPDFGYDEAVYLWTRTTRQKLQNWVMV